MSFSSDFLDALRQEVAKSLPGVPDDGEERFPELPAWLRAPQGDEALFFLNNK